MVLIVATAVVMQAKNLWSPETDQDMRWFAYAGGHAVMIAAWAWLYTDTIVRSCLSAAAAALAVLAIVADWETYRVAVVIVAPAFWITLTTIWWRWDCDRPAQWLVGLAVLLQGYWTVIVTSNNLNLLINGPADPTAVQGLGKSTGSEWANPIASVVFLALLVGGLLYVGRRFRRS